MGIMTPSSDSKTPGASAAAGIPAQPPASPAGGPAESRARAWLDRIAACNRFDPGRCRPFRVSGTRVGWVAKPAVTALAAAGDWLSDRADGVDLSPRFDTPARRTAAFDAMAEILLAAGMIRRIRGERYPVLEDWGRPLLATLDRGLAPVFGTRSFGVHVNGLVASRDGPKVWIATRAPDVAVSPNKKDNMVAGGLPVDLPPRVNVIKEAAEEAGVPADLAAQARPAGMVRYRMDDTKGVRRDTLFVYDLWLPQDFRPENRDGEVACFDLVDLETVAALAADGQACKFNIPLVLIDLLIRLGVIAPEDPAYADLVQGLRQPA